MKRIKEGFQSERLLSLPEEVLSRYRRDPFLSNLYIRKMGFFPRVAYHYVEKPQGTDYAMLVYCTEGTGMVNISGRKYTIEANQYIIVPSGKPYSLGASENDPWSIYWVQFCGAMSSHLIKGHTSPQSVSPGDNSRIIDRLDLFEELFSCFANAQIPSYMYYASSMLYHFLGSLVYLEPFRGTKDDAKREQSFIERSIRYMENCVHTNLSLRQLAEHFNYSPSHYSALFQREVGMAPINYFIRIKIRESCKYLRLTQLKIVDIAHRFGFDDPAYYSRIFTKIMGMSPKNYRLRTAVDGLLSA